MVQSRGTERVGALFGPVTLVWFLVLAVLGIAADLAVSRRARGPEPVLCGALSSSPQGPMAFVILGAVFLVVTGGEALYADMGHFGKQPIRSAWFCCALPCLVLNYFGQGALVLGDPAHAPQPFYHLAPGLGALPADRAGDRGDRDRLAGGDLRRVLADAAGRAARPMSARAHRPDLVGGDRAGLCPCVNITLAIASIGLVARASGTSGNLAAAYGLAVSTTMVITTVLTFFVMKERWKWPFWPVLPIRWRRFWSWTSPSSAPMRSNSSRAAGSRY